MSLAGLPVVREFEGVDQAEVWRGHAEKARDGLVAEDRPHDGSFNQRIYITPRWKLVAYSTPGWGELYDTEAAPHQIVNLWHAPPRALQRHELLCALLSEEMNKSKPVYGQYPRDSGHPK